MKLNNVVPAFILPLIACATFFCGVVVSYCVTIYYGHRKHWPYIDLSSTGYNFPEELIYRACMVFGTPFFTLVLLLMELAGQKKPIFFFKFVNLLFLGSMSVSSSSLSEGNMNWRVHMAASNTALFTFTLSFFLLRTCAKSAFGSLYSTLMSKLPYVTVLFIVVEVLGKNNLNPRPTTMAIFQLMLLSYFMLTTLAFTAYLWQKDIRLKFSNKGLHLLTPLQKKCNDKFQ